MEGAPLKVCYATKAQLVRLCEQDDIAITDREDQPLQAPFLKARVYLKNAGVSSINSKSERWLGKLLKNNKETIRRQAKKIMPPEQHQGLDDLEKNDLCEAIAVVLAGWNEENELEEASSTGGKSVAGSGSAAGSNADESMVQFGDDAGPIDFCFKKSKGISFAESLKAQDKKAKRHRGSVSSHSLRSDGHNNKKPKATGARAATDGNKEPRNKGASATIVLPSGVRFDDLVADDDTFGVAAVTKDDLEVLSSRVGVQAINCALGDHIMHKLMTRIGRVLTQEESQKPAPAPSGQNLHDALVIDKLREEVHDLGEENYNLQVEIREEQDAYKKLKKEHLTFLYLVSESLREIRAKGAETVQVITLLEEHMRQLEAWRLHHQQDRL